MTTAGGLSKSASARRTDIEHRIKGCRKHFKREPGPPHTIRIFFAGNVIQWYDPACRDCWQVIDFRLWGLRVARRYHADWLAYRRLGIYLPRKFNKKGG